MSGPPKPPSGGTWELFGHASVDSGTLAVIDPCYVIDKGVEIYKWDNHDNEFEAYCNGLGVQFYSGFGDGTYEVWGYVVDFGDGFLGGKRVAQVIVSLIKEGDEEDDEG